MSDETPRTIHLGGAAPPVPTDALAIGAVVGGFRVTAVLAAGGGGRVYAAEHRVLQRRAAVKVLHRELAAQSEMVERFVREAKAVNRIAHPNIVDIYELGVLDDGRPYYVMELMDGADLATELRRRGRLSPHEALAILTPLCDALHAAHQAGFVHRDLKASNVLFGQRDGRPVIKLHDFGVAKLIDPPAGEAPLTGFGRRLGTPYAMAPEQIRGEASIDHRVDVYAMGVLVFQMLTGTYPFAADEPAELESMHLHQPPPRPSQRGPVSAALEAVILKCLEKRAADRHADMPALLAAFKAALADEVGAGPLLGLALHIEAPLDDGSAEDADRLGDALDRIEGFLAAAGYALPLQLAGALLAVRAISDATPSPEAAAALSDVAAVLRIAGDDAPRWRVVVHVDGFQVRAGKPFAGPLLRVSSWVTGVSPGVTVTAAARRRLPPDP